MSFMVNLKLMRPKQWIKNSFVLAPVVFSSLFLHFGSVVSEIMAFIYFCIASSATYVLNDLKDVESDRQHPKKSKRPIASGAISEGKARQIMYILYGLALSSFLYNAYLGLIIVAYLGLNIAYSNYLKHQPVLDIFTIAIGFVLRVYAGAVVLNVPVSEWMLITVLSISLFLASVKRRQELISSSDNKSRSVLQFYSTELIEKYTIMSSTASLIFYTLYITSANPKLIFTVPFVYFGIFRYWFIVYYYTSGESPTDVMFKDRPLQIAIVAWAMVCLWQLAKGAS